MKANMTSNRYFLSLAALAVLGSGAFAGQALAAPTDNPPTVTVSYADLNLANPAGFQTLHRRIEAAARSVCGDGMDSQVLEVREASRDCYKTVIKDAMKQIGSAQGFAQK